jgi:putative spermidine/putrescine transport system permease protein
MPITTLFRFSFYEYTPPPSGVLYNEVFTLENFRRFSNPVYLNILFRTLKISGICSTFSMLLSYPVAYTLARGSKNVRGVLLTLLVGFLLTFSIVRIYGWVNILGNQGVINDLISSLGFKRIELSYNERAVIIGTTHFILPFAILSLAGSIQNIDPTLEDSARNLGADDVKTFLKITLPLSLPGIISATLLSFALSVSAFITPLILGGRRITIMSNLIYDNIIEIGNYPFGSTVGVVLLTVSLFTIYGISNYLERKIRVV